MLLLQAATESSGIYDILRSEIDSRVAAETDARSVPAFCLVCVLFHCTSAHLRLFSMLIIQQIDLSDCHVRVFR